MTKHLFILGTLCCFALSGCMATVKETNKSPEALDAPAVVPKSKSQATPEIPPLPGVGCVDTPDPLPPASS